MPDSNNHNLDYLQPEPKQERTFGLKMVDGIIYPIVNYGGVFAVSVASLYLGTHGNEVGNYFSNVGNNADNPVVASLSHTAAGICNGWANRSREFDGWLVDKGFSQQSAEMTRTVALSFLDGCALAPAVKMLEDRRVGIAKWIDEVAGTTPEDQSIYDKEPVQSWGSVIGGRAMTALIVVPVAIALENNFGLEKSLNQYVFYDNGIALGEFAKKKIPALTEKFTDDQLHTLFRSSLFEGAYTMICSLGLMQSSKLIAETFNSQPEEKQMQDTQWQGKVQVAGQEFSLAY